jgi:hypothetical protein
MRGPGEPPGATLTSMKALILNRPISSRPSEDG